MDTVPDATTLIKFNQRFGEKLVADLNKQLVGHLVKHRAIKPRRIEGAVRTARKTAGQVPLPSASIRGVRGQASGVDPRSQDAGV
jgi:hypothetical protein